MTIRLGQFAHSFSHAAWLRQRLQFQGAATRDRKTPVRRSSALGGARWPLLALAALAVLPFPAHGQAVLEEVLVTATRRDTDLQTTPISVSAIDSTLMEQANPRDLGDLAVFVPNFSSARVTSFANAASFGLRGVGQNNIIVYYEPPVSVVLDDFALTSVQTQLLDTFDLDQVEVLRGPQGTLFGKNTTGGAISVRTKRPSHEGFSGAFEGGYGSFGTYTAKGALNAPLAAEQLALRVVGAYRKSDGFVRNGAAYGPVGLPPIPTKFSGLTGTGEGERTGGFEILNGRVKLLWEPADNFSALLQYEFMRDDTEFEATVNETPMSPSFLFHNLGLGQSQGDPLDIGGTTNRGSFLIDLPGLRVDIDGIYLNMDRDLGMGTATSITGFRRQASRLAGSETGNPPVVAPDGEVLSPFDINRADDRETFQQELRFASQLDGPLNFVSGVFYQHEEIDFCVAQILGFLDLAGAPTSLFSFFGVNYGPFNQTPYILCSAQKSDSTALYTEGTYDLTERLTLTAGFRYTWESKTFRARQQIFVQELGGASDPSFTWQDLGSALAASVYDYPFGVVKDDDSVNKATWRISLGYQVTDNVYAYAMHSRGFKSGGYNDQIGNAGAFGSDLAAFQIAVQPTKPETADSFEAGVKTEAAGGKLRFNATAFYVQYKDLQRQINIPLIVNGVEQQITQFFNAAKAEVKGVETELAALPMENLTLRAVFGYQDCDIKSFFAPDAGYDLTSAPCERAPEVQWTLDATYEWPLAEGYKVTLNGNVNYLGKNLFTQSIASADFNTFLDARTLWNASVMVSDSADRYFVRLVGRNLSDKRHRVASQTVAGLWTFSNFAPPRYIGGEIGLRW